MSGRIRHDDASIVRRIEILLQRVGRRSADPELHNQLGICYCALEKYEHALSSLKQALSLCPTYGEAWYNLGLTYEQCKSGADAYAAFVKAYILTPNYGEAKERIAQIGSVAGLMTDIPSPWPRISDLKKRWIKFTKAWPRLSSNSRNPSAAQPKKSEAELREFLSRTPTSITHLIQLSELLYFSNRLNEAKLFLRYCLGIFPSSESAANLLALTLTKQSKLTSALEVIADAINAGARKAQLLPHSFWLELKLSHWRGFSNNHKAIEKIVKTRPETVEPLMTLFFGVSLDAQLRAARDFSQRQNSNIPHIQTSPRMMARKIKIGYVSADYHDHPVAQLVAEVFELHDRKNFNVEGFALLTDDGSKMRRRVRSSFDKFTDLWGTSNEQAAKLIAQANIDILVDLNGYTTHCRPQIFARRPSPIQINYLGYPGTMGADFIDYMVVDETVVHADEERFYSEKMIYMPHSYQANDRHRAIGDGGTRASNGLPDIGFVFCCFNANTKITPPVFDIWMRVLRTVPQSVLWLFSGGDVSDNNLRQEATARGVDASRLVFAPRVKNDQHIGRYKLADLFLDTWPYNAHTTASEALWAGCPVVTCMGSTFAGRVAASLLKSVQLEHLIASSPQEYEQLIIDYARNPQKLTAIRDHLAKREALPLFDTPTFVKHLESAYREVYERYHRQQPLQSIYVKELIGECL
jgi:predicted O-linked N-acetylglucosamine transferase (SPINDLY family)